MRIRRDPSRFPRKTGRPALRRMVPPWFSGERSVFTSTICPPWQVTRVSYPKSVISQMILADLESLCPHFYVIGHTNSPILYFASFSTFSINGAVAWAHKITSQIMCLVRKRSSLSTLGDVQAFERMFLLLYVWLEIAYRWALTRCDLGTLLLASLNTSLALKKYKWLRCPNQ